MVHLGEPLIIYNANTVKCQQFQRMGWGSGRSSVLGRTNPGVAFMRPPG
jgi:hypothetical protein